MIDLESRRVHIAGVVRQPHGAWIQRHLRFAISEFVEHYHLERNHQGLDNRLLTAVAAPANENADLTAPIARRERLGGLLSYYYRAMA